MPPGARNDPFMSYRYVVIIDQIIEAGFSEISGLEITTQVEDYREGGVNEFVYKLPKETTFANLILKRGLADQSSLWKWHHEVVSGNFKRKSVQVILLRGQQKDTAQMWSFKDAYPVKWTGPELKADANAVAFQSIELAHHGYEGTGNLSTGSRSF